MVKIWKHTEWLEGGELVGWAGSQRRSTAVEWRFPGDVLWERAIEQQNLDTRRIWSWEAERVWEENWSNWSWEAERVWEENYREYWSIWERERERERERRTCV
jgi:hypothetical protein